MARWLTVVVLLCAALSLRGAPALAKGEPAKDEAGRDEEPEPTDAERQEIRKLVGGLGRGHEAKRTQAAAKLAAFGPKAEMAVPALVNALRDRHEGVATTAAATLGKVGVRSKAAVRGLVSALSGGSDALKRCAAESLGQIGPTAAPAVRPLVVCLQEESADVRRAAAFALGFLGPEAEKRALGPLEARLRDEPPVQLAAAASLARLGSTNPELAGILARAVPPTARAPIEVRSAACEALAKLGAHAASAVPALSDVLSERPDLNPALPYVEERRAQHDALRRAAATALGEIGAAEAAPALRRAASDPALQEAASAALAKLERSGAEAEPR